MTTGSGATSDRDRFRGALLGLAVGDAIGTAVEFSPPGTFSPVTDMTGGGPFDLPAGAWTDDTSMALCLAESLIETSGFDPVDQLERYVRWYREGHLSSTGRFFDIGNATRAALERFEGTGASFPGDADPQAAGNGPLMRLAPVALAYAGSPERAVALAGDSARTTHGAPQAIDACRYFAALLLGALDRRAKDDLLAGVAEPVPGLWERRPLHPEVLTVARGSFLVKEPPAIRGGGYVVEALEAALWALATTTTFEAGVLAAANLGDDADTTAAIYGQLAGALYGAEQIPSRWREQLVMGDLILEYADGLLDFSLRRARPVTGGSGRADRHAPPRARATPGDSYWVIEGRLLAGPYPGAPTRAEAEAKIDAFLDAGVTCFVDLTEEGEGPPLHPYAALLRTIAARRNARVTHMRMPIRDADVPTDWQMRTIISVVRRVLDAGEVVYVHCWGGVGRTGTVVGCMLVEEGLGADEVIDRLATLRDETARRHRTSPETEEQRRFVRVWRPGRSAGPRGGPSRPDRRTDLEGAFAECAAANATRDGWGLAWYLAAELCTRFYASHGVKPEVIEREGLGYYGIALVQLGCFGRTRVALGRLTMAGNVESWTTGVPGDHGLALQARIAAGTSPSSLLPEVVRHLGLPVAPDRSHAACRHRRRGASFELVFRLAALLALRWEGKVQIWNADETTRDLGAAIDRKAATTESAGYFVLSGPRQVVIAGDGRVLDPASVGSLWQRYMAGASVAVLLADLEEALELSPPTATRYR